ncbi:MAG: hypothetical protein JWP96_1531 [Polaromonas sp.]|nr:hypothetical protein [Polaromonas sp.]
MKINSIAYCVLIGLAMPAVAAVSEEEAKQLSSTLTPFGAIKAGNATGTIPAYTGGVTKPPAGFKPDSGIWVDPFQSEKPLLRIDSKNMDKYAASLSDGQKKILQKFPAYYLEVYPSHRSVAYPEKVLQATVRNGVACKTSKEGLAVEQNCRGGIPFPIPKTGREAMWNHLLRYQGITAVTTTGSRSWVIDSTGRMIMTAQQQTLTDSPYYQTELSDRDPAMGTRVYSHTQAPARRVGEMTGLIDYIDPVEKVRRAWSYTPGQRRVKLAPEFSYDTPVTSMGGVIVFDELSIFAGKMDRFDFKLVGKKEMYIPYNQYRGMFECPAPEMALLPQHNNPACDRWEMHRVWVVEATLKPGQRHIYSKRVYYFDEDLSGAGMSDAFDQSGEIYRVLFNGTAPFYDSGIPWSTRTVVFDLNRNMYTYLNDVTLGGLKVAAQAKSERELNPEAIVARESSR